MNKYDEDLYDNPFFVCIQSQYPDLHGKLAANRWTICIPKHSVAARVGSFTEDDVRDHILCPPQDSESEDGSAMRSLSGKEVQVKGQKIFTGQGYQHHLEVDILFEETFHGEDHESYRAVCVNGFLNRPPEAESSPRHRSASRLTSYDQCMEVLWCHAGGQKTRDQLDKTLDVFCASYARLEGANLRSIVDAANAQFTRAMQLLLKDSVVKRSAKHNENYMESLKVAVETYLMHAVHHKLFGVIMACMASQDAELNKLTRNLAELQLTDMGIRKIFSANIPPAKRELASLNRYSTPLGRLFCIKRVVAQLTRPLPQKDSSDDSAMTTDDFLPILIFLIIKSEIPNWMANLMFMKHFHFSKSSSDDEFGFYLASIEAALEHIRSGRLKDDVIRKEKFKYQGRHPEEFGKGKEEGGQGVTRQSSKSDEFFVAVQGGREDTVVAMLQQPQRVVEEVHLKLCHPLCSCDQCERQLASTRTDSDLVTAYTRDNKGYTALHIAAYHGQAQLIDVLVKHGALVNASDYLGLTPLHLACQRGFQNVLLLLLHFGGDVMAKDNDGNIPLHLCAANGHEDCVKALVFAELPRQRMDINTTNDIGDSALHLAAKWGYENIVRILLENGANPTLRNRKKQRAISLTHNPSIQAALMDFTENPVMPPTLHNLKVHSPMRNAGSQSPRPRGSSTSSQLSRTSSQGEGGGGMGIHVETATLEEEPPPAQLLHNKDRLFKAIADGDLPLVKYYLGLEGNSQVEDDFDDDLSDTEPVSPSTEMCHPLCQCHRCLGIQKARGRARRVLSVNTCSKTGYSLLHLAVLNQHTDLARFLLQQGADVNACNHHRRISPLHAACHLHNEQMCRLLLEWDCHLDLKDSHGDTPLHTCCENGFLEGARLLLEHKAGLDLRNGVGNTALLLAVDRNHVEIARLLLAAGADPRLGNRHGQQPAQLCKTAEMAELLGGAMQARKRSPPSSPARAGPPLTAPSGHIRELFAALGSENLETLKADIRGFKGKDSLRRTITRDNSSHRLSALAISHAIQTFDQGALRHVSSVDRSQPLHMYALAIGDTSLAAKSLTPSQPRRQSAASSDSGDASLGQTQSSQGSGSPALGSQGGADGHSVGEWDDLSQGADSGLGSRDVTLTSEVGEVDVSRGTSESPVDTSTMSTLPDVEMDSMMSDQQVETEVNGHCSEKE